MVPPMGAAFHVQVQQGSGSCSGRWDGARHVSAVVKARRRRPWPTFRNEGQLLATIPRLWNVGRVALLAGNAARTHTAAPWTNQRLPSSQFLAAPPRWQSASARRRARGWSSWTPCRLALHLAFAPHRAPGRPPPQAAAAAVCVSSAPRRRLRLSLVSPPTRALGRGGSL